MTSKSQAPIFEKMKMKGKEKGNTRERISKKKDKKSGLSQQLRAHQMFLFLFLQPIILLETEDCRVKKGEG